jgi:hypothetical protein
MGLLLVGLLGVDRDAQAAGGHYAVDDATLTESGRCQLEVWYQRADSDNSEISLLPACNPWGNLEIALGWARWQQGGQREDVLAVELKTLQRELQPGAWGWGVALATTFAAGLENAVAYVPVSIHLTDALIAHYNLGVAHERGGDDAVIWGVGGELAAAANLDVIAEIHGTHRGGTQIQAGLRHHLGNGALDLSFGFTRADTSDNWLTLGFVWAF